MAKVSVILNCQIDNGKSKKHPGETVSMDEKEARKLADMGMVKFPEKEKPVKAAGKEEVKTPAETDDDDLDPDALDQGGKGEGDEGE